MTCGETENAQAEIQHEPPKSSAANQMIQRAEEHGDEEGEEEGGDGHGMGEIRDWRLEIGELEN